MLMMLHATSTKQPLQPLHLHSPLPNPPPLPIKLAEKKHGQGTRKLPI